MELPKPTAIIFDWDNTLVDTWPIIHGALEQTFEHMGREPWSLEETKDKVGKSLRDHFPSLFGDRWEEAGDVYVKSYRDKNLINLTALPQAEEMLDYILELDIYRAVVSNKQGPTLRAECDHIEWNKYFHKVIGASDAPRDKPFADPAILALKGSDITPSKNVWFIGDSTPDVECAKAAGLTPIIYGNEKLANYYENQFCHVAGHDELLALLKGHFEAI